MSRARRGSDLWRRSWLGGLLFLLVLVPFGWLGIQPSPDTVFAVQARTGVVEVQPMCGRSLIWDLPRGRLTARSCDALDLASCSQVHDGATVTLYAGASARLEMRGDGLWGLTLGLVEDPPCVEGFGEPLRVTADAEDLAPDPAGFFYVAEAAGAGEAAPPFAFPLTGRVTVGQFVEFGGGWTTVHSPTLTEGRVFGRDVAVGTGERLTLLEEELDPGSIVDTHPAELRGGTQDASLGPATGFIRSADGDMLVQLSQQRSVGVMPYDGVERRLEVARWKIWWASPFLQVLVSVLGVMAGGLGIYLASQEARQAYVEMPLAEAAEAERVARQAAPAETPAETPARQSPPPGRDPPTGQGQDTEREQV